MRSRLRLAEALLADAERAALQLPERDPTRLALEIELRAVDRVAADMVGAGGGLRLVELAVGPEVDQDRSVLGLPLADRGLFEGAERCLLYTSRCV